MLYQGLTGAPKNDSIKGELSSGVYVISIIAVDDEMDAKILFDHFFKKEVESGKVNLQFVQSANDCLERLKLKACANTLVVTDINMPDTDGIKLSEIINRDYPEVKIFLVSAYEARSQLKHIQHLNIAEYITKPVDFSQLKEKIFLQYSEA